MTSFHIGMGQATQHRGDFSVGTTALYSCALVCIANAPAMVAGAFHYPSEGRARKEIAEMYLNWLTLIKPTQATVVFAEDNGLGGTGADDIRFLLATLRHHCGGVEPQARRAVNAGMVFSAGLLSAGRRGDLDDDDFANQHMLSHYLPGTYDDPVRFTLLGRTMR